MNTKIAFLLLVALLPVFGMPDLKVTPDEPEKQYLIGEDSLYYEEVDGKPVHVMMADGGAVRIDTLPLCIENYFAVCEFYNISDPEIVYAQSCLESGHFTSVRFRNHANHLGIKAGKKYASYGYWAECLKAYADKVQYRKRPGEDHYAFLKRIGYAEDPVYINKVKSVVKSNRKRNKSFFENR